MVDGVRPRLRVNPWNLNRVAPAEGDVTEILPTQWFSAWRPCRFWDLAFSLVSLGFDWSAVQWFDWI